MHFDSLPKSVQKKLISTMKRRIQTMWKSKPSEYPTVRTPEKLNEVAEYVAGEIWNAVVTDSKVKTLVQRY